jgi:hypothetical protein
MYTVYLKMKIKSLTEEARIIRCEEKKYTKSGSFKDHPFHGVINFGLHDHRVREVRSALRNSYLAYAYIRGRKRVSVEHKCYSDPDYGSIARMAYKYGYSVHKTRDRTKFAEMLCQWLHADKIYDLGISPAADRINNVVLNALKRL